MLYGGARITAIDDEGRSFVRDKCEGDLLYFPTGIPHSIQGLAPDGSEFLLVFADGSFSKYGTVLLSDLMAHTPKTYFQNTSAFPIRPSRLCETKNCLFSRASNVFAGLWGSE
jgi:oxalate decarboxylase